MECVKAERDVICSDAIGWMTAVDVLPGDVFTSIPDIAELDQQLGTDTSAYKAWFENATNLIFSKTPAYAIFLQTDIRCVDKNDRVTEFIDKSFAIHKVAEQQDFVLLWHKICSHRANPEEKRCSHKPVWSHLLCYCRRGSHMYDATLWATPDVFYRGDMVWSRGIGINSTITGVSFLKHVAHSSTIVDPFCGQGTILAVSNAVGIPSVGCDLSPKRCRKAVKLDMSKALKDLGRRHLIHFGLQDFSFDDVPVNAEGRVANIERSSGDDDEETWSEVMAVAVNITNVG
jgi:hypothetical protein